jgi:hypothetical protein
METIIIENGKGFLAITGRELPRMDFGLKSDVTDPLREFEVTVPELERLIRASARRQFFVRFAWFAASIDQNGHDPAAGRVGYDITGNVQVSKREALRVLAGGYTEKTRATVWAHITISKRCFFIGG